ncbi:MAG: T9SS type A sorting domain-containing protein [Lacibacter sp.]
MTYLYPTVVKAYKLLFSLSILLFISQESFSQLVFKNSSLIQGDNLKVGATYRFSNVTIDVDALVTIDSLVNGASVSNIDLSGSGYNDAFQPQVKPGNIGTSYALFNILFVKHNTSTAVFLSSIAATNLDLDGSLTLKEMCEIDMNGGSSKFMNNNPTIAVSLLSNKFRAINLAGVNYGGIDTSASEVMFEVKNSNIASFKVRFGAVTLSNSGSARQYSLYMKEFAIANATTLPVTLTNFQANLKDKSASLVWTTANQINFSHFVIEKSTDGKNFQEAAVLFADEANTSTVIDYKYKDNLQNSSSKVVFYRLKMVDANEKYAYSETRMVRLATEVNSIQISTFPNPVTSEVRIMVPADWQEKAVTYEIYNSTGVLVQRVQNQKAAQVQQINVQNLNGGNYIVKVSSGSAISTSKIIKLN